MSIHSIITGSGKYLPGRIISNSDFLDHKFLNDKGEAFVKTNRDIINKLQEITDIKERRYLENDLNTSDMAFFASISAIEDANIDPETLDYIIVAHNFGDIL
jgi:3-oxoacyl-[acyl-carrier-protein] synthase-3